MKTLMIRFAVAASLVFGLSANAADTAPRKEAVLDTGKGGLRLVVSVPSFGQGPYDFSKNDGIGKSVDKDWNHQEVMFNAPVGETGVVVYQASLDKISATKKGWKATAETAAKDMLERTGFAMDRAVKIDSPQVSIPDATVVTYKATGYPIFNNVPAKERKLAIIVTAVSFSNDTQSYTLMAKIAESDIAAFDADSAKFENRSINAFKDLFKNHKAVIN